MSERVLPKGWGEAVVTDISGFVRGVTFKKAEAIAYPEVGYVPIIRANNIQDSKLILDDLVYAPEGKVSDSQRIKAGDVVVAMSSGSRKVVGKSASANKDWEGAFGAFCGVFRPSRHISSSYFGYYFGTQEYRSKATSLAAGANINNLKASHFDQMLVPIPGLEEQKAIADKLDELLSQVNNLKSRLDTIPTILKRFRQSVLEAAVSGRLTESWRDDVGGSEDASSLKKRWLEERKNEFYKLQNQLVECGKQRSLKKFKEPVAADVDMLSIDLPKGWCAVSVSEYAECLDSYRVPVKKERRASSEKLYPYFGANGEVDRVDEYIFDEDLVMVTEDETFYGREKPIAYRYTGKCWVNNHAHVLRAPTKQANDYLCYSLMHYNVLPWLSGTTGRAKLTQAALNSMPITLPPEEELNEIVRRVEQLFAFADQVEQQVANAQARVDKLTQSILAKAFRGELTAEWRAENPKLISGEHSAEALLERIKAEKAKQKPAGRGRKKPAAEAVG